MKNESRELVLNLTMRAEQLQAAIEGGAKADIQTAIDRVGCELRKLQEILLPDFEIDWLAKMTIRSKEILDGLASQNSPATFQGRMGFWCQGDCVFIQGVDCQFLAIEAYRERLGKASIGITHNYHCGSILALRRADWLNAIRKDPSLNDSLKTALSKDCP